MALVLDDPFSGEDDIEEAANDLDRALGGLGECIGYRIDGDGAVMNTLLTEGLRSRRFLTEWLDEHGWQYELRSAS